MPYPPNRGDRIRALHAIRFLSTHADVYLGSVADEPWGSSEIQALEAHCKEVKVFRLPARARWIRAGLGFLCQKSVTQGAFYSKELALQVRNWTQEPFDAAVVFCSSMGQYIDQFQKRPKKILVDLVDVDSQKWIDYTQSTLGLKQWVFATEARRVARLEKQLSQASDAMSVVSQDEADIFRKIHPELHCHAFGNGVDYEYFSPTSLDPQSYATIRCGNPHMVFIGVLDYFPNVQGLEWFCRQIMPRIRDQFPQAVLDIVGRSPSKEVVELSKIPGVRLIGPVPDVRPYVLAADFSIAPLQIARGIQNKVLESLSCGRPVIATEHAATGIASMPGLLVAKSPENWTTQIHKLMDSTELERLGSQSRQMVIENYSWDAQLAGLLPLLGLNK